MINIGIIGIGGMGRLHFNCYNNNEAACVVAICDVDQRKLAGDWSSIALNVDASQSEAIDLTGIRKYSDWEELLANPEVRLVDICLPTPLHAPVTLAALQAGKDVFCEKPMALQVEDAQKMERAARESERQLMIGHCIRYWPHYEKAREIIQSGELGHVKYVRLHRGGRLRPTVGNPGASWNDWMRTGSQSGGVVIDTHIHDVDIALWWLGRPQSIVADGCIENDLPVCVDATWRYAEGALVYLHSGWDINGTAFGFGFKVALEKGTLTLDSSACDPALRLFQNGDTQGQIIAVEEANAYQRELDDYIACLEAGRRPERLTPADARLALEVVHEELRQIQEKNR